MKSNEEMMKNEKKRTYMVYQCECFLILIV